VRRDERAGQFEVDVIRPGDEHRVFDLVPVLHELAEAPCADVELFLRELFARVQRFEDCEPDFEIVVLGRWGHESVFRPFGART